MPGLKPCHHVVSCNGLASQLGGRGGGLHSSMLYAVETGLISGHVDRVAHVHLTFVKQVFLLKGAVPSA